MRISTSTRAPVLICLFIVYLFPHGFYTLFRSTFLSHPKTLDRLFCLFPSVLSHPIEVTLIE
ncbi:hypothetical protein LX36DRAFT_470851 [Colletotrichum falcatum]|nr:hypothetical protein LX36DRAFT_470851 [Colletotrichum falcatum]